MFGAILVAGPRQVGKTTMLDQITNGLNRATLDDPIMRAAAEEQSGTFFWTILLPYSLTRYKKPLLCSNKLSYTLTKIKRKVNSIYAALNNSG